ncbi:M28 family metallopeptidase [Demequina mangrovi]|uniref:Zn-dependent amino-or carboxypeptidase, M28 family n=1 Tax=Demequina mangrovi TaxID=1043493 RepID=A0A1H6UT09_9MICO|nr:M28 family metallopeptidase [Demequina mangrovi]SEI91195.1 Zn-dependent amino-or carboxypeptidase, M28 family [Demequina mangrovi]
MHRKRLATLGLLACGATIMVAPAASAGPKSCDTRVNNTVEKLLECVSGEGAFTHLAAFQAIADANGGTRASSTPGYDASVAYVAGVMEDAGYDVSIEPFTFDYFEELTPATLEQTSPNPTTYEYFGEPGFATMEYSGSGTVTATAETVDVMVPAAPDANTSTSGCESADFAGFTAGNIAVVQRGSCSFYLKAANAEAAGASAVIIFNEGQPGRESNFLGTLGGVGVGIPVVGASYSIGEELYDNPGTELRIIVDALTETRETSNVIAESKWGDPGNVVMAGAHLDSVPEGPGVNDNGSGSAAILEVAENLAKVKTTNKVRFAWWGAEESGLIGSYEYAYSLTDEEIEDIALYLNFDMVGSPNYMYGIYDGDGSDFGLEGPPGSDVIEATFQEYYESIGMPFQATEFSGRSDYAGFIDVGIPAGGLFTGAEGIKTADEAALYGGVAGEAYDPCYHSACDTIDNVSREAMEVNTDAVAYATLQFAMNTEAVNGVKGKGNFKPKGLVDAS